ncbi:hypothetical protein Tco_0947601 [Tanacetum coccineum]
METMNATVDEPSAMACNQMSNCNLYDSHDVNDKVRKSIRSFVDELFKWRKSSYFKVFRCSTADASDKRQQQQDLTSSTSTLTTTMTADGNFDL